MLNIKNITTIYIYDRSFTFMTLSQVIFSKMLGNAIVLTCFSIKVFCSCCHYKVVGHQVHALQSRNLKNRNNLIYAYCISQKQE